MGWSISSWVSKNSSTEQETTTAERDDKRNFITARGARESDVDKELEHDEMQPQKMQRNTDEQSIVIYGLEQEQGSSSNSQLSCDNIDWLSKNSSTEQETTTAERDDKRNFITARESDVDKELEHDEMQPHKMQRNTDEQSIVIYGLEQEQGSSSNSQLSCDNIDWLSSYDSANYPKIVTLIEKLGRLFARRKDILKELNHEEFQPGKKRREEVRHWLTLVQGKYDEIRNVGSSSNSNLPGCIERFIKEVAELIQTGQFPNGLVLPDQESTRLPLLLEKEPVGINFKWNAKQILKLLQNHKHCIIGVYGMGGVGKTTLLLHIHDQLLQDARLDGRVYWVTVSQSFSVHKLQQDIAKELGLGSLEETNERRRAAILHNKLAAMDGNVLILDDMWEQISVSEVGIPVEVEGSGCKVILSTRSREVCLKMGCKNLVIKAEILSDEEAWDLFVDKLGHYNTLEEEAKEIARCIAKECGGLPLAIATMACSMRDNVDINDWKVALHEVKSLRNHCDMKEDVFGKLRYSYDRIKDNRIQNCFLSCILFGEDEKITRKKLINMWIHEGLFDEIESWENQEAKGQSILNKLESWCLLDSFLNYQHKRCVKMHDLVRDMSISITKEQPRFIAKARENLEEVPEEKWWSNDLVKASLSDNFIKEIPSGMAPMTPNLTVLMLNCNFGLNKIPESFFRHMKALKVLDLSRTSIDRVPHSVSGLVNLKALLLCKCIGLTCVSESFFKDMKFLQVLDLSYTSIIRVPESVSDLEHLRELLLKGCRKLEYVPSVVKLTKLRMLDLSRCYELKAEPRGLERLKSVEVVGYCPWDISNMRDFSRIIQSSWSSLTSYQFWIRDPALFRRINVSKIWQGSCKKKKKKNIWQGDGFREDDGKGVLIMGWEYREEESSWMLPKTVEVLGIEKSDLKGRSLVDVLPSLNEATNLKEIKLEKCRGMISITKVGGALDSFSDLTQLEIFRCGNMKVVFSFTDHPPHTDDSPNWDPILVELWELLKKSFQSNEGASQCVSPPDSPPQSNPIILSLPNLKELHLINLPKLKLPIAQHLHLPKLKELRVEDCEEVEVLFFSSDGSSQFNPIILSLTKLKKSYLNYLPRFKFPITQQLHLPNLTSLRVEDCEEVEEIFQINKTDHALPNLEELRLINLPKLKRVFSSREELYQLPNLKKLIVINCEEVEEIFQIYNPNLALLSLSMLFLKNLPKLKRIIPFTEATKPSSFFNYQICKY